ncbi:MAG: isoprenoid biosynthesis glyoxalase ElbB [Planctomycetota bacterium JB042]
MKKVAVILSGCGVNDGAEIHESVVTLLALDRLGADVICAAPNKPQADVIDHAAGAPADETRNVLVESARIARGDVTDLAALRAADVDAVVMPGGFGAAKNLCTFAQGNDPWEVDPEVARFLREMHAAKKPIGAMCIAPAAVAGVLGGEGVTLTIGTDEGTARRIESTGARHEPCLVDDVVIDHEHKVVSTPAYMLAGHVAEAAAGIEKLCAAVVEMA